MFQPSRSRITSRGSPPFYMTAFSASLTKLTALLHQSPVASCYVSRPIPAPPPLRLQKYTELRAPNLAQSPDLWHQHRLTNVTCAWNWRLCGINPALNIPFFLTFVLLCKFLGLHSGCFSNDTLQVYCKCRIVSSLQSDSLHQLPESNPLTPNMEAAQSSETFEKKTCCPVWCKIQEY
jgi:hypothetical protein